MKKDRRRKRGDIIWVDLGQHLGRHIQSGRRPCLIVNTNKSNAKVYTVMPGTCQKEKDGFPVHVTIEPNEVQGSLSKTTIFMAEQLVTVDENQVMLMAGYLKNESDAMRRINEVLMRQLEIGG